MNRKDFLIEAHTELDHRYSEFVEYQEIVCDIFNEFHRICKKNDITYYLAFGSLLGFFRDGGMIPWDTDIDVLLPINELNSLISALKRDLSSEYYFTSNVTDARNIDYLTRVCKKGYAASIIHIDILYLIGGADSDEANIQFQKEIQRSIEIREKRLRSCLLSSGGRRRVYLHGLKDRITTFHYSIDRMNKDMERLCKRYQYNTAKNYITFGHGAEFFPAEIFEPRVTTKWMNGEAFIPKDVDQFLTIRYGDYHRIFPIKNRFNDFIEGYRILVNYAKIINKND